MSHRVVRYDDTQKTSNGAQIGMANSRVKIWKCGTGGDPAVPGGGEGSDVVGGGGGGGGGAAPGQYGMVGHGGPV